MKFTPEVIAALQTLKNAAENDFERHRIDVLEKDLTEPPKVEVIDEKTQKFNGFVYHIKKDGHFHGHISIQRAVYSYYFGEIESGYNVHHIDNDKTNNDISNFLLLTNAEHQRIHFTQNTGHFALEKFVCVNCGKDFVAYGGRNNRFCSDKCKGEYKRQNHQETRTCAYCGKEFSVEEWSTVKCCSNSCAQKLRHIDSWEDKVCPVCNKEFRARKKHHQVCCSSKCAHTLLSQRRREKKKASPQT